MSTMQAQHLVNAAIDEGYVDLFLRVDSNDPFFKKGSFVPILFGLNTRKDLLKSYGNYPIIFNDFELKFIKSEAELVRCFISRSSDTNYINGVFMCNDVMLVVKYGVRIPCATAWIGLKDQQIINNVIDSGDSLNHISRETKVYISGFRGISNKGDWFNKLCSNFHGFITKENILMRDGFLDLSGYAGNEFRYAPS